MDRDELDTLLATISIHVSQFFRNPDTFRILEQKILPDLCRQARADGRTELTLWSAGCATGEEPYSLALLVDDLAATDLDIRILATDISEPVLEIARSGYGIFKSGREVGRVTSGGYAPSLGVNIGFGYVPIGLATIGTDIEIMIRNKPVLACVVNKKFYTREK